MTILVCIGLFLALVIAISLYGYRRYLRPARVYERLGRPVTAPSAVVNITDEPEQTMTVKVIEQKDLQADVRMQAQGGPVVVQKMEVSYAGVPPIGMFPTSLDFWVLGAGDRRTLSVLLFSTTRDRFTPTFEVSGPDPDDIDDPCLELSPPVSLTAEQFRYAFANAVRTDPKAREA